MRLPSEVLRLGAKIVRELELDESTSTLSRWMAHHLAETMKSVETADPESKERLEEGAVNLILELWAHRRHLPGHVHPLARLGEVIAVCKRLHSDALPFRGRRTNELEELLWRVFNALQIIVIQGVLASTKVGEIPHDLESPTSFLTDEENETFKALRGWIELSDSRNRRYEILSLPDGEEFNVEALRLRIEELNELEPASRARRIVISEIEGLMETLSILRSRLNDESCETDDKS